MAQYWGSLQRRVEIRMTLKKTRFLQQYDNNKEALEIEGFDIDYLQSKSYLSIQLMASRNSRS